MAKQDKVLESKLGLLALVEELGNVSRACQLMGYSRDSYYRLKAMYDKGGVLALQEKSRRKPHLKNRLDESFEKAILKLTYQQPTYGQSKVAEELKKIGHRVSPSGVRTLWQRYDLEHFDKRLKALGTKILQEDYAPTETQLSALKQFKTKPNNNTSPKVYFPGHLMIHRLTTVADHQKLGKLYQFILLDKYSHLAFVYLSTDNSYKQAIKSLKVKGLPFFEKENLRIHCLLTTKDDCFYGKTVEHPYRKFAKNHGMDIIYLSNIDDCFRPLAKFLTYIENDFYREAFRTSSYSNLTSLQADLDDWLTTYNTSKRISESYNYGKMPMETFKAILPFTKFLLLRQNTAFSKVPQYQLELLKKLVIPKDFKQEPM